MITPQVEMELNILTLPGYGDKIDNTDAWRPVKLVVDERVSEHFLLNISTSGTTSSLSLRRFSPRRRE